ncbi:unnamed protein product [Cuscuta campestris]|uniref:Uncharacterized protein n=1 Tax=Cuscuta campestris TaxID=132261 RepID=A0A484MKZ5_9ASTE|nr:unnamed protein product [Cuscuta campestris]
MALNSVSLKPPPIKSIGISSSLKPIVAIQSPSPLGYRTQNGSLSLGREPKIWRAIVSTALAAAVITSGPNEMSAMADLNKFEAAQRGEFGIGSAAQFGSADLK